jgi:hypothetical protein
MATKNDMYLYFMEQTDGAFDAAYDAYCPPLSSFRGFNSTGTTTTLEMQFDSILGTGADIAAVDKVVLTITANKQKEVMDAIVQKLNSHPHSDGFLVIADDTNSVYATSGITGGITACAVTVTAAA